MPIDLNAKSSQLLQNLANSILDRDPASQAGLFFTTTEIQIVEKWLSETIDEVLHEQKSPPAFNLRAFRKTDA